MTEEKDSKNTEKKPRKNTAKLAVEILKNRTKVGGVICATGARLTIDADKAKSLEEANLAKIIGV